VAAGATRILLDDALQTRHRPRWTVAIVLDRDLARPPRPLPAGPAREGSGALDRADALLVRRETAADVDVGSHLGFRLAAQGVRDAEGNPMDLPRGKGMLLSGLARPESFEADALALGLDVVASWREPDHWTPAADSAVRISRRARQSGAQWILVPEKNLERVARLRLELPLRVLVSRIVWDGDTDPLAWLRERGVGV
jgi:tetraacyldisaccharide-1-P 4'-kinase